MTNPQTLAEELYKRYPDWKLDKIRRYACCAFVLLWCLGIEPSDIDAVLMVTDLMEDGALDDNCKVYWNRAVKRLTGRELKEVKFTKINDIKNIKERTPVYYKRYPEAPTGHWVGVENGKIGFNPLSFSVCVEEGQPVEMRELIFDIVS